MRKLLTATAVIGAIGLSGCASDPTPHEPDLFVQVREPDPPVPPPPPPPAPNSQAVGRVVDLGSGISMLIGQGGNLGLSVGDTTEISARNELLRRQHLANQRRTAEYARRVNAFADIRDEDHPARHWCRRFQS